MTDLCWHQRQRADLAAARKRVTALDEQIMTDLFGRLRLCYERTEEADAAWARGDHKKSIALLQEELDDDGVETERQSHYSGQR